ncbi:bifunctional endoribonuclease/protein kinase ire1 [Microsporum canis]|uniref:non-specific serine/threonine protein kinase n=1 Tax=Arthroderma otae (strain ATCC MYA-4605 / CBS 113480) TaxID=554155 RepID=C5FS03_ARTOC|nr:serine/threonine-protein kinase/endoribonuclease IRE1 [Microsporum canis CBS 113480]EEQ32656.1 serine/threonine-protein kinase/endoribonuclease IRE1 [Microsporum canis CBS 113480]
MIWRLRGSLPASLAILFPLLATQQQLLLSQAGDVPLAASFPRGAVDAGLPIPNSISNPVHPSVRSDESALETLALAASGSAVRAPPVQISSRNDPTPQLQARSLQDWEVEDFVLLATVDGTIHARDRKTGAPRWALEVPSSPMVETVYHRANRSHSSKDAQFEDDFLWIVEPSRDGNLFIYNKGQNGGLQRLGLTVKMLVDETPYSGIDPPVTYTARKETTLYTVDARTGSILRMFSSRGLVDPDQTCRRLNDFKPAGDECKSGGKLTLGRIEYTVSIQNTNTGQPICTIKYAEWAPNNRDVDLQGQYFKTMDERHIYSMHDGVIFGFDHSKVDGRRYTQRFSSPVARVFDVARPLSSDESDTPLAILSQPPSTNDYGSAGLDNRESRVFINCTDTGGWYAMSELTYPLVTGRARIADCYDRDFLSQDRPLMSLDLAQQKAILVGVHSLAEPSANFHPNIPSISGPLAESSNDTPKDVSREPEKLPAPAGPGRNSVIIRKGWDNALDIFVTLVLLFIGTFIYYNTQNIQELIKHRLDLKNIITIPHNSVTTNSKTIEQKTTDEQTDYPSLVIHPPPEQEQNKPNDTVIESKEDATPPADAKTNLLPSDQNSEPQSKEAETAAGDEPADGEDAVVKSPRRKARRGRRGGQAHKRGKKNTQESTELDNTPSQSGGSQGARARFNSQADLQLARTTSNTEIVDADGAIRIGQLKVYTDKVLGHGSHGTVVYKGSFDGRNVAVKRLLVEFYDIAAHEVGLLQESDDHSNVIRYFCREQTAGFLYIALELCPASLQDIVERPHNFPELLRNGLVLPDILRQITAGVRYLHSLKIVHRDLKPQNILVAAQKSARGVNNLRLLISDFGLCKKLEDNQSSFRATTAHAAGTSGWRAPELLVDDDQTTVNSASWANTGTLDSSEPAVVDPQTNRRATRAIDIFSLGCVFYYVLTHGSHPFDKDGKFMREANIVKGYYNLDELQRLGNYAFEAEDLISRMLSVDPRLRPDATSVMIHPFFWSPAERLSFLCDVSDHFEFEPRDPPSPALQCLESVAQNVMYPDMDFLKLLPKEFKDSLGKQRKYTGSKMLDLLRALRNKRNHYNDMSEHLKAHIGGLPDGYLNFWTVRFPGLLINCHWVVRRLGLVDLERFKRYFTPP